MQYIARYSTDKAWTIPSSRPARWQSTAIFKHDGADHCIIKTALNNLSSGQRARPISTNMEELVDGLVNGTKLRSTLKPANVMKAKHGMMSSFPASTATIHDRCPH